MRRRGLFDIYADILRAIGDGCVKTRIVYRANLNFIRCNRHVSGLFKRELVKVKTNSPSGWAITSRGYEFLRKYEELKNFFLGEEEKK